MISLKQMTTEQENINSTNLSSMPLSEAIRLMNSEDMNAVRCIESELDKIEQVISLTSRALENNGRIIYIGAGTSGRLGVLDAVECPPTFGVDYNTVVGLIAGGEKAFIKAKEGAEDDPEQGACDLQSIELTERDVVIGIAASGRTPYVIGGIKYAKQIGAECCAIVCNSHSTISQICPLTIELLPGPEVLTGSTRLKAGTATKLVLNMISTLSMIRLGKIYKNYMVDVKTSNEKLISRAVNIVCSVTDCNRDVAEHTLFLADNHVKTAIVMILTGSDKEKAKQLLAQAKGKIENIGR